MTYIADFLDRDDAVVRCRPCGYTWELPPSWLADHVGEHIGCPGCGLSSRIPTIEESAWPGKKDPGDPVRAVPQTERERKI